MNSSSGNNSNYPSIASDAEFEARMAAWKDMPSWLADKKREAWARFKALPEPTKKRESWRFAKTDDLALDGFASNLNADRDRACPRPIVSCAGCLDFADDVHIGGRALDESLVKEGVIFMPLEKAIAEYPEIVREHLFARMPNLGSEKYEALHVAMFLTGAFLYVPKGVEACLPIAALHEALFTGGAIFPHTLVVAGENSRVTMIDVYRSLNEAARHFACAAVDLVALPGARISHRILETWNDEALAFHLNSLAADHDSSIDAISINLGGGHVRMEQHGRIIGRGGDIKMHSLSIATKAREIDQRTLQTHSAEDGKSDLLYKNVLLDNSHTIFGGLIRVDPIAQRTDAFQTNRNLLLSTEAEADSLPGLEILANDVKCSHGASTGQINPEELFYLLSRGIDQRKAEQLLVAGFFEEVIGKIDNPELEEYARGLLAAKFTLPGRD
jgi:Fe-S cluster assembly protein SufD